MYENISLTQYKSKYLDMSKNSQMKLPNSIPSQDKLNNNLNNSTYIIILVSFSIRCILQGKTGNFANPTMIMYY